MDYWLRTPDYRKNNMGFRVEEIVSALYISLDQGYLTKMDFDKAYVETINLVARISALIKSLNQKSTVVSRR